MTEPSAAVRQEGLHRRIDACLFTNYGVDACALSFLLLVLLLAHWNFFNAPKWRKLLMLFEPMITAPAQGQVLPIFKPAAVAGGSVA